MRRSGPKLRQRLMMAGGALVVALAMLVLGRTAGDRIAASVDVLPVSLAGPLRSGLERVGAGVAPGRGDLKWIHVDDPRSRKTDKLVR